MQLQSLVDAQVELVQSYQKKIKTLEGKLEPRGKRALKLKIRFRGFNSEDNKMQILGEVRFSIPKAQRLELEKLNLKMREANMLRNRYCIHLNSVRAMIKARTDSPLS